MRLRLKPHEAEHIGRDVRPHTKDGYPKYRLSQDEYKQIEKLREGITSKPHTETSEEQKPFVLSAWKTTGGLMNIQEYCKFYSLPYDDVKSYKLVSHTGVPFYNIQFTEKVATNNLDTDFIKNVLRATLEMGYNPKVKPVNNIKIGVVKIADLHYGAFVDNLLRTPDYNSNILAEKLEVAAEKINQYNFSTTHIHLVGDLIETFTGLSHINSWKSMDKNQIGAMAVKGCTKMLHEHFFSKIDNIGEIKIIAGNHDRVTSNKQEDEDGDAANLIAWGLKLMGYDIEFHSNILTHEVAGINHIILHGHNIVSKRPTKEIIWDYGKQGVFNLVTEGHLHSIIEKLTVNQRSGFKTTKDDSIDHRRIVCPSFFTGNSYSEKLNFFSHSGFMIVESYQGVPEISYKIV